MSALTLRFGDEVADARSAVTGIHTKCMRPAPTGQRRNWPGKLNLWAFCDDFVDQAVGFGFVG
jgi:hypothetical protein